MSNSTVEAPGALEKAQEMFHQTVDYLQNFDYSGTGELVLAKAKMAASVSYDYGVTGVTKGVEYADQGADMGIKGLEFIVPWLTLLVWMAKVLIPLAAIGYGCYLGYKEALNYWSQGKPSEYQLQLRNGELINQGVGLTAWTLPGDQIVSFPSGIQQIAFEADQVTREMQGVKCVGKLLWAPFREGDGPFRLYKAFGEDLKTTQQNRVKGKVRGMAVAIVRDVISNSTIDDILKNREKLRKTLKQSMQPILTGWGMWLETIEISEVAICSSTLFDNMQAKTKEEERLKAFRIEAESQEKIRMMKLKRDHDYERRMDERKAQESSNKLRLAADKQDFTVKSQMREETEAQNLERAKHETTLKSVQNEITLEGEKKKLDLEILKKELTLQAECLTDKVLKMRYLKALEDIWDQSSFNEVKFVNVGVDGESKDTATELVRQMITSYSAIQNAIKSD